MLFSSFEFLVFFSLVLAVHFAVPVRARWAVLLAASYLYYAAAAPVYLALLVGVTAVTFGTALALPRLPGAGGRRLLLALCVAANLGLLFSFKYLVFFAGSARWLTAALGQPLAWNPARPELPIGISFYTFQALAYVFDVYRGTLAPTRHAGHYAAFVGFFPQLLAGPIQRAPHLLPQLAAGARLDAARFRSGLVLAVWGVFKKLCIGDLAAPVINRVYEQPTHYSNGSLLLLATVLFSVRVYCDFSGYTDTAIGVARMLGYDLTVNFRQPYFAPSVTDFWRRWHLALTSWFRDYVYIPLGGNRVGAARWAANVLLVFVLSGLWHGAAWTFVAWGLLHGLWLVLERAAAAMGRRSRVLVAAATSRVGVLGRVLLTYLVVLAAWVLFNARSFPDAWYIFTHVWRLGPLKYDSFGQLGLPDIGAAVLALNIAVLLAVDAVLWFQPPRLLAVWARHAGLRALAYQALAFGIVFFGVFKKIEPIYFQF